MAKIKFSRPRGTADVVPAEAYKWHYVERVLRRMAESFGFGEIRFPTIEHTELFLRGVGDTTDVVQKEMYTFTDKGGRSLSLRPEGTASTVRAYLENALYTLPAPFKAYYIVPNFRYEKPQSGRLREHHQFGAELFGSYEPEADAEIISFAAAFLSELGVKNAELSINSIGCAECRPKYLAALREYFKAYSGELCQTCLSRLEKNPMRILDCKSEVCSKIAASAPRTVDFLCVDCAEHLQKTEQILDSLGVKWTLDPGIVRGLDYYTRTVFEFVAPGGTVCGGGRYDGLVGELGGQPTGALGFGCGIERLLNAMDACGVQIPNDEQADIYLVGADEQGAQTVRSLAYALRRSGTRVLTDLCARSVRAQMKAAGKSGARFCAVIGASEAQKNSVEIKNMVSGQICEAELSVDGIKKAVCRAE